MAPWCARLLLALVLAGGGAAAARADELDAILALGRLQAGVCLTSGPAGFRDSDGNLRGYDVDVATLMAQQLGVTLQIVETTVETRMPMLLAGQFDVIVCTMTATPERGRQIDFSLPYLRTGIKMMVEKGSAVHSFDDLGKASRVVVERGTTGEALVRARVPDATIVYAGSPGDEVLLMRQGKADAAVDDGLLVDWAAKNYPDELEALRDEYSSDSLAIGARKGNPELLRWLDLFASRFVSSGQYAATYRKWWGTEPPPIAPVW